MTIIRFSPSLLSVTTLCCMAVLHAAPLEKYKRAVIRTEGEPGVRYSSGLTVCDEALREGHWVNRYWLATGMIKPEFHLERESRSRAAAPPDAFELSLEGQNLGGTWKWVKAYQEQTRTPSEGLLVTVELESTARPVSVKVRTLLGGGPVLVRWLEITNRSSKATAITRVSPWSGRLWSTANYRERIEKGTAPFEVAYAQYQDWGTEGAWKFFPVENDTRSIAGTRGKSGWGHPTFFAHNRVTGEWFVSSLGYSGNWKASTTGNADEVRDRANLTFSLGPDTVDQVLRVLDPQETVKTPETHMLLMASDLDHVIQALHDHVRGDVILPPIPGREYQVESNHRGYIVDHEDEPGLLREVDLAHDVGAEEFLIDAGWFGPDPNRWGANVGDWHAGSWLPNDITPVREYTRKKGMLFGLWVEIESSGAASELRKKHPEWSMTRNGRPVANGRQLDLTKPEVAAWVESEIARIIQKYDLDMFRIDYNHSVEEGGNRIKDGFTENLTWRYVDAFYGIFDRIHKRFPKVILQNCAGGGGRLDLGIMRRFHNTELSDWMRGPRNLKILNGMTWILPPEILLRTFGTEVGEHATDGDINEQLRIAMICRPIFRGISPTSEDFNPISRQVIRDAVQLFKDEVRPIMVGSRVYHHTPLLDYREPDPWLVLEYATQDCGRAVATLFRTSTVGNNNYIFRPRGLDFSKTYRVRLMNSGNIVEIDGTRLLQEGIPVRIENPMGSEMLIFQSK
ncbi:MAG: alpha-galactosidase [Bryobacteraceae bacterium]